ncbi:MAG: hypothetical protein D6698_12980 [Gammaproteobacteria bacterium]|nr:MAG: hypothetical protein D6698_12980 [Gammaproteobacteria bacterium]
MTQEKKSSHQDTKASQDAAAGTETGSASSSMKQSTRKEKVASSSIPEKQNTPTSSEKKPGGCRQCAGWLFVLVLILLGCLAGGGYWYWLQLQGIHDQIGRVKAQMDQESASLTRKLTHVMEQSKLTDSRLKEVQVGLENAEERQTQLQEAVQALHTEMNKGRFQGWRVSESSYLLHIANDRLYLARDVDGAVMALKAADQRLREVGDPSLLSVRTAIADEIGQLQIVPKIDFAGLSAQLISLQKRVGDLTLLSPRIKQGHAAEDSEQNMSDHGDSDSSRLEQVGQRFVDSLRDLVKIRHKDGQEIQFLPADQRVYLSQNIRLKLEVARLSLLQRNDALFHQSLAIVLDWLKQYYRQDQVYQALEHQIQELQKVQLIFRAPDISGSGKLLQSWLEKQESAMQQNSLGESGAQTTGETQ